MSGELPEGWVSQKVGDVFLVNPPKPAADVLPSKAPVSFVPMAAVDAASGSIRNPKESPFGDVRKGYTAFADGDVIVAKITPCFENGKAAVATGLRNGLGFGSSEFHVFRPTGAVTADLLYYYLRQPKFREEAAEHMSGTAGQERVPVEYLRRIELPIPPLPEQRRIVEKVEALLEQVNRAKERLERVTVILKRFRQAVLAAACSGELTRGWRAALGPEAESDDNPSAWRRKPLEEIASPEPRSIQSGPFGSNLLHSEFQNHGRLVIGIDNVADGAFVAGRQHRISEAKFRELERYRARPLDVLITVMATVGRSCVVPENIEPAIITKHVYRISCDRTLMNPHFLLSVLRGSPELRGEMHDQVRGQTRPGINGEILKELVVPVPPLDEQAEIVRQVNRLFALADAIERRVRAATAGAEKLPQAILSKAFSGELVPTEAELARAEGRSYETAEELLARVRLEGAEAVSAPKRQRRLAGARGRR